MIEQSPVTARHLEVVQVIRPTGQERMPTWGIKSVGCPSGRIMNLEEALQRGLINLSKGVYVDPISKDSMPLPIAIEKGLVTTRPNTGDGALCALMSFVETKSVLVDTHNESYLISSVHDQLQRTSVDISTALNNELINFDQGTYYNNRTEQKLHLSEAFRLGYLRGERVTAALPYVRTVGHSLIRLPHEL